MAAVSAQFKDMKRHQKHMALFAIPYAHVKLLYCTSHDYVNNGHWQHQQHAAFAYTGLHEDRR